MARKTYSSFNLVSTKALTLAGLPAIEVVYDVRFENSMFRHIDLSIVVGTDAYEVRGATRPEQWDSYGQLLEQLVRSFTPGPTADTRQVPPKPPNSRLEQTKGETLYLSNGNKLFQGTVTNKDSYWWATDIRVTLTLRNASDTVVWELGVTPSNEKLKPRESARYEIRVPAIAPAWETSQVGRTWKWSCP